MNGYGLFKTFLPVKGVKHTGMPGEAAFPVSLHTTKYLQHSSSSALNSG